MDQSIHTSGPVDPATSKVADEIDDAYNHARSILEAEAWHPYKRYEPESLSTRPTKSNKSIKGAPAANEHPTSRHPETGHRDHIETEDVQQIIQYPVSNIDMDLPEAAEALETYEGTLTGPNTGDVEADSLYLSPEPSISARAIEERMPSKPKPRYLVECAALHTDLPRSLNAETSKEISPSIPETKRAGSSDATMSKDNDEEHGDAGNNRQHTEALSDEMNSKQPVPETSRCRSKPKAEVMFYVISQGVRTYWSNGSLMSKTLASLFEETSALASRKNIASILFTISTRTLEATRLALTFSLTRDQERDLEIMKDDFKDFVKDGGQKGVHRFEVRMEINPGEMRVVILEDDMSTDSDVVL